ncbi:MAG TPA: YggT family protein [Steroidobacteraceae bacterium]|nr:YggT family protein [Steroidobacteraceae bacterium]
MQAIRFIVDTLLTLYAVVLLLRLLLQLVRADFRNPLAGAILQLTNPVILPLRKLLPPLGKIDTATVAALVLCFVIKLWLGSLLFGVAAPALLPLLRETLVELVGLVLTTYLFSIFINAILSFVAPGNYSPVQSLLAAICDPVLKPFRRLLPPIAGLDLSPLWACIAIQALLILLR